MKIRNQLLVTIATAALVVVPTLAETHAAPADDARPAAPADDATARPATPAPGATAKPTSDGENKVEARKLFVQGSKLFQKAKYKQAIKVFTKAYSFWKNPKILLNIAICHAENGDAVQAVIFLRKALSTAPPEVAAKLEAGVPAGLKSKEQEVVILKVVMPDPTAEIFLNDMPAGYSPVEKVLLPGDIRVTVKLNGEVKVSKTLTLAAGARETFELTSWPAPEVTPDPKSGSGKSWRRWAKLPVYYFGAAALVTLAGAAALIGTGVKTESIKDDYVADPNLDTRDKGIRYRTATNVLTGITVVAGVGAAVLGVLFTDWSRMPWKKKEKATTRLTPSVGPGGASLTFSGSF